MKNRSVKLSVDEPCQEDWGKMTPVEQGRFCNSCSKVVIDFSGKSDHEVLRLIDAAKGGETCGQFASDQLNRSLYYPLKETSSFSLRAVLFGATLTSILGLESCRSSRGRGGKTVGKFFIETEDTLRRPEPMLKGNMVTTFDHSSETEITGTVFSLSSGKPISGATIRLFGEDGKELEQITAQDDGKFRIQLNWKKKPDYVAISASGYEWRKLTIKDEPSLAGVDIGLVEAELMLRGKVKVK